MSHSKGPALLLICILSYDDNCLFLLGLLDLNQLETRQTHQLCSVSEQHCSISRRTLYTFLLVGGVTILPVGGGGSGSGGSGGAVGAVVIVLLVDLTELFQR